MASRTDRRGFFRQISGTRLRPRPPWALPEQQFASACDGCSACIQACPQAILVLGVGKLPYVDFARGGCTLCGGCADACVPQAILGGPPAPAWDLRAHISTACLESQGITCRVCETACDEAALRFQPMRGGRARVIVATDHCTGCGTCLATCPAGAISIAAQDRQSRSVETAA